VDGGWRMDVEVLKRGDVKILLWKDSHGLLSLWE